MSKAILQGSLEIGAAIGLGVTAFLDPALVADPLYLKTMFALGVAGIGQLIASGAEALLDPNQGPGITTQQAAQFRPIVYGMRQVAGTLIWQSTTGSHFDQDNNVIVVAGHPIQGFVSLYLDGRKVSWSAGSADNKTFSNGVSFGGNADGGTYIGPNGAHYSFGDLIFADAYDGTQSSTTYSTALQANDSRWAPNANGDTPSVSGCAYAYLKIEYHSTTFPSRPQLRWVIQGKNDIYDPRTGTRGYTTNWALIVADVLMNTDFGLGVPQSMINMDQLIAAANVCDEMVACAAGMEARYTCHWSGDTQAASGDILAQMMPTAQGRVSFVNGQFYIYPAYWQGVSFAFDENDLVGTPEWKPYRKLPELFNRVQGVYLAPWFPYAVTGDEYDRNGWYDGTTADLFPLAWQPTSFPYYAQDPLHGYASDQWLAEDDGRIFYKSLQLSSCNSVSQAQRVAKIALLRNRWQGEGTLQMSLSAYRAMPTDVMDLNFSLFGWVGKQLEITGFRTVPQIDDSSNGSKAPYIYVQVDVASTDASIYEWSSSEELTINTTPILGSAVPYIVAPPTNVVLDSSAATAITGADGVVTPRVEVTWDSPEDAYVTTIGIEYAVTGSGNWIDAGPLVDVDLFQAFVSGVVAGGTYDFRIRSLRANGAASDWVTQSGYVVSATYSSITSVGISPNIPWNVSNDCTLDSISDSGTATVRGYGPGGVGTGWDNYTGSTTTVEPAFEITGLAFATVYYVVLQVSTGDHFALTDYNSSLADGYLSIGSLTTISSTGSGGTNGGGTSGGGGGPRNPIYPPQQPPNTN